MANDHDVLVTVQSCFEAMLSRCFHQVAYRRHYFLSLFSSLEAIIN